MGSEKKSLAMRSKRVSAICWLNFGCMVKTLKKSKSKVVKEEKFISCFKSGSTKRPIGIEGTVWKRKLKLLI